MKARDRADVRRGIQRDPVLSRPDELGRATGCWRHPCRLDGVQRLQSRSGLENVESILNYYQVIIFMRPVPDTSAEIELLKELARSFLQHSEMYVHSPSSPSERQPRRARASTARTSRRPPVDCQPCPPHYMSWESGVAKGDENSEGTEAYLSNTVNNVRPGHVRTTCTPP